MYGYIMVTRKHQLALTAIGLCLILTSCDSADDSKLTDNLITLRKANATSFSIDGGTGASYSQSINLISFDSFSSDQQWLELDRGNGYYSYQKRDTEFCMDGQDGGSNGQNVVLWTCEENNYNQHWQKVDISTTFRLEKRNAPEYSIFGGSSSANAQIISLWRSDDTDPDQQWFLTKQGAGTSSNLVTNGTFEDNLEDWSQIEPAFESGVAYEGEGSVKLEDSGSVSQRLILQRNTQYKVSAMIEGDASIGVQVGGQTFSNKGTNEDYTLVTFVFNSGNNDNAVLFGRAALDTTRIDNIAVYAANGDDNSQPPPPVPNEPPTPGPESDPGPEPDPRPDPDGPSNPSPTPLPEPSDDFEIEFGTSSNRSGLRDLNGATVSGNIYTEVNPASQIDQVLFYIDNTNLSGTPTQTENFAPYDLQGTTSNGGRPFNTNNLSNGSHTLSVRVLFNDGSRQTGTVRFEVDNGANNPIPSEPPAPSDPAPVPAPDNGGFGLNPKADPWENFDLIDVWALDTPAPRSNDACKAERTDEDEWNDISNASKQFIFTHSDGGMRFTTRIDGQTTNDDCNKGFVRSELREMLRAGDTSVSTTGVNKNNWKLGYQPGNPGNWGGENGEMHATLRVNKVTTTGDSNQVGRVIVGQIHADDDEPLRLYYRKRSGQSKGCIYFAHEIRGSDDEDFFMIGNESCTSGPSNGIELDELFSYSIINDNEEITVIIRRGDRDGPVIAQQTINMDELDSGYDRSDEWMYFKAGAYTQNNTGSGSDGDIVTFYRLSKSHN